jgi:DHA1 family multidrug resistance protein-like MFS transporter
LASAPSPPSSWVRILVLFSIATFVEAAFWGQVGAFTPLHLPRLGIAAADVVRWTGLSVALSSAVGLPFLPLWGALADRFARKPVIIRSYVAHVVAAVVMLAAGSLWIFIAGRAAMSFALGNSGLMMTTLSERAPRHRVGLAFSLMNSAAPFGVFVGPVLGGRIVDRWGFPMLMLVDAVLMLGVILSLALGYRDAFTPKNTGPIVRMAVDSVRIIARSARLRSLFPALFILFAGWTLAMSYAPLVITAIYHGSDRGTVVGLVLGAGGLTTIWLSPAIGALADRFGHWRVLFATALVEVALWPLPALAGGLVAFAVAWAIVNGIASGVFALSFSVLSTSAPSDVRARVMSFAFLPVNIGSLVGPAVGSLVTRGSVFRIFPAAVVLTALGVGALWVAHRQPAEDRLGD